MVPQAFRRARILELLDRTSNIRVARLSEQLQVSEMTVRRDLRALEDQGALRRVHGGAVLAPDVSLEESTPKGLSRLVREKTTIAGLAMTLVEPDLNVFVGGGSTMQRMAQQISFGPAGRYSTNSMSVARAIATGRQPNVYLFGGNVSVRGNALSGPETIEMLARSVFDIAFIGTTAIDAHHGFLEPSEWHAVFFRTLRRSAKRLVVLADHTKFAARSDLLVLRFHEVDTLVTDRPPPANIAAAAAMGGLKVMHPI